MNKNYLLAIALLFWGTSHAQQNQLQFGPQQEAQGRTLDNIVAIVGTDVITRKELSRYRGKQHKQALDSLIMRKLLLQEAQKLRLINNSNQQIRPLQKKDEDRIIAALQQKVVGSLVTLSDREVNDLVETQLKSIDDQVRLVDVLIKNTVSTDAKILNQAQVKTQEIIAQLKKSTPQAVAAQHNNVVVNDLGWVKLANIPPMFSRVIVNTSVDQYASPVVDQDGTHILKVLAKKQKSIKNLRPIPETKVSHILIKDAGNTAQAEKTIIAIYNKLQKGSDFSTLARKYSQDPGSAINGGDLGWTLPGKMVASFESVMNRTKQGTISKPFKSEFGFHILKVEGRRNAKTNNRDALTQQVRAKLFQKKAAEEWASWLVQLRESSHIEIRK